MKYYSKKTRRIKKKMIKNKLKKVKDEKYDPFKSIEKIAKKSINILSTGGKVERSYKKRVGNIVNKNNRRYDIARKVLEKIEDKK